MRALHPDVVVMDINMPRMNGLEAAKLIKREFPRVGIVGLSIHESGEMVETMAVAGISFCVTKDAAAKRLCPRFKPHFPNTLTKLNLNSTTEGFTQSNELWGWTNSWTKTSECSPERFPAAF